MKALPTICVALLLLVAVAPAAAQPVEVTLIAIDDDVPPGATDPISSLGAPFTSTTGALGFTGGVFNGATDNFVWFDTGITWLNSSAVGVTLTGAESTMGIGPGGEFIYSPAVDGADSVWTENGLLFAEDQPIPGVPGQFSSFNSRPQRFGGTSYWVGGLTNTIGGSTQARALFRSTDTATPVIDIVFQSGDMIGGFPIDFPSGVGFDYSFSHTNSHHIHDLLLDTGSTTDDGAIYVNGSLVARESLPTGDGDNWDNFDVVSINNFGNYLFSGDTDGATSSDEFLAYNGTIALREGDVVDGTVLGSSVLAASINNLSRAVFAWNGAEESLFFAADPSDLASAVRLLSTGEEIDIDEDGVADFLVDDFNASNIIGPGLDLADSDRIHLEVDLLPAGVTEGAARKAIIAIGLPGPDLEVTPASWDYGPVDVGTTASQMFTFTNAGELALTVGAFGASGDGGSPFAFAPGTPPPPWILESGESVQREIVFAPTEVGLFVANAEILSNDPNPNPFLIPLAGEGTGGSVLEIPTLGPGGVVLLALLLAAAAFAVLRRRTV